MFRYLSIIWNPLDSDATASSRKIMHRLLSTLPEYSVVLSDPGITIVCTGLTENRWCAYRLGKHRGVILGTLFKKRHEQLHSKVEELASSESEAIVNSRGITLIDDFWGRYVAIVKEPEDGGTWILRDPQGGLQCFVANRRGVSIIFSHVEDCIATGLLTFTFNWRYLASYVWRRHGPIGETALAEACEVVPGERLHIHDDGRRSNASCWTLPVIVKRGRVDVEGEAKRLIRVTTMECIWAWASCYSDVLHFLSGGLDSSIVLHCLSTAPNEPNVTCANRFESSSAKSDERMFARIAAKAAGCPLMELEERVPNLRMEQLLHMSRTAKPACYLGRILHEHLDSVFIERVQPSALFYGIGGDQIFYHNDLIQAVIDFALEKGLGRKLLALSMDVARARRTSVWSVLHAAIRARWMRHTRAALEDVSSHRVFVNRELLESSRNTGSGIRPWLQQDHDLPPGKLRHLEAMTLSAGVESTSKSWHVDRVYPLVSQPIVELAARIPTYVLIAGGTARGLVRAAFASEMPPDIIRRRTKGGIDVYVKRVMKHNLHVLRELFLDGILVRERILDRAKIDRMLSRGRGWTATEVSELMVEHLSTEIWLRSWLSRSQSIAA